MKEFKMKNLHKTHMLCTNKFVITDTRNLISPAGFHPDERVFGQTDIAIHCDVVPAKLPASNRGLYLHDVDAMVNA